MVKRRTLAMALAMAGGAGLLACGDEPLAASGRSMSAPVDPQASAARALNARPQVESVSLSPSDPQPGQPVEARVSIVDPEGDPTHARFTWRIDGVVVAGATGASMILPEVAKGARIEVEVVASEAQGPGTPASADDRVGNRAPEISAVRMDPASGLKAGAVVVAVVDAVDADGDDVELQHQWFVNGRIVERDGDGPRFDTTGLQRGDQVAVRAVASDGDDDSESVSTPSQLVNNTAPAITSQPPAGMGKDGVYRYAVEASDPDGDRALRFHLVTGPDGTRVDPLLGEITWTPTFQQTGTHPIEVAVTDGQGGETKQRFEVTVREVVEASPPAAPVP